MVEDILPFTKNGRTLVITSDNCAEQYKCVACFNDVLSWCDRYGIEVKRTYGIPGHGKGEIDACGGHVKQALQQAAIMEGQSFYTAKEAMTLAEEHFAKYPSTVYREYHLVQDTPRESDSVLVLNKLAGSRALRYMHFKANIIITSPLVCSCHDCIEEEYLKCIFNVPYFAIEQSSGKMVPLSPNRHVSSLKRGL